MEKIKESRPAEEGIVTQWPGIGEAGRKVCRIAAGRWVSFQNMAGFALVADSGNQRRSRYKQDGWLRGQVKSD